MISDDDRTTDIGLMNYGWAYVRAGEHLQASQDSGEVGLWFSAPIEMLAGHSFELLFKSFLKFKGTTLNDLKKRKEFGHSLQGLMKECEKNGLALGLSPEESSHFYILDSRHGSPNYEARYIRTGSKPA